MRHLSPEEIRRLWECRRLRRMAAMAEPDPTILIGFPVSSPLQDMAIQSILPVDMYTGTPFIRPSTTGDFIDNFIYIGDFIGEPLGVKTDIDPVDEDEEADDVEDIMNYLRGNYTREEFDALVDETLNLLRGALHVHVPSNETADMVKAMHTTKGTDPEGVGGEKVEENKTFSRNLRDYRDDECANSMVRAVVEEKADLMVGDCKYLKNRILRLKYLADILEKYASAIPAPGTTEFNDFIIGIDPRNIEFIKMPSFEDMSMAMDRFHGSYLYLHDSQWVNYFRTRAEECKSVELLSESDIEALDNIYRSANLSNMTVEVTLASKGCLSRTFGHSHNGESIECCAGTELYIAENQPMTDAYYTCFIKGVCCNIPSDIIHLPLNAFNVKKA